MSDNILSDSERLKKVIKELDLNANKLAVSLGLRGNTMIYHILKGRNGISEGFAYKLCKRYPQISIDWLLKNEGNMKSDGSEPIKTLNTQTQIPMYDVEAVGGTDIADTSPISKPTRMINIGDLLSDSQAAIRVYGNSMLPGYPSGCVIGIREMSNISIIEWGEVYVIETRDARYIKRLYSGEENKVVCYSDNTNTFPEGPRKGKPMYEPFEVPKEEIIRLHRVTGSIKRNDNSLV